MLYTKFIIRKNLLKMYKAFGFSKLRSQNVGDPGTLLFLSNVIWCGDVFKLREVGRGSKWAVSGFYFGIVLSCK